MANLLRNIVSQNRAGAYTAIPSVCSTHQEVLVSSLLLAQNLNRPIVIEATSNQVNQFGGYTRMTPLDFVEFVSGLVRDNSIDPSLVILGGDHLGPQVWKAEPAEIAMEKACTLVAQYVNAGIRKIHLDCSEGCANEPAQLDDAISSARAAKLAKVCRDTADDPSELIFVIGTEVPPPGGARMDESGHVIATTPDSARKTILAHQQAFDFAGISDVWPMVSGLVVQPGIEFAPDHVHHFPMERNPQLLMAVNDYPTICLEAHSTDYQNPEVFPKLAKLGFAFQKVGPALTFSWRRAMYALDHIRSVLQPGSPRLPQIIEDQMRANPSHWKSHYDQNSTALWHFGYADRIRYYWPTPAVQTGVADLLSAIDDLSPPLHIFEEFFSTEVIKRADGLASSQALSLGRAMVQSALIPYFFGGIK